MKTALCILSLFALACTQASSNGNNPSALGADGNDGVVTVDDKADSPAPAAERYTDAEQYLIDHDEAAWEKWFNLRRTLRQEFDDVCGDTFCEGDYSNLYALRLRCSVDNTTGVLKSCKYVFGGSYEEINPSTGSIRVTAKTFSCALPVSGISLSALVAALTDAGSEPALRRPLPGKTTSIYDALVGCL